MATPQIDYDAQLHGFLLRQFVQVIKDTARNREERVGMQMEFESFILSWGARILPVLQRAVAFESSARDIPQLVGWFVDFVSPLGEEWLREVNVNRVAVFWPGLPHSRERRTLLELIAKAEWVANQDRAAQYSEIVRLFRDAQPDPNEELTDQAGEIAATLFRLAKCARLTEAMYQASITRYSLRVLSFCFKTPGALALNDEQAARVMQLFGNLTTEQRRLFEQLLLLTTDV